MAGQETEQLAFSNGTAADGEGGPTPTQQRRALIAGCEEFDKLYPPGPSEVATAEEAVDNAIAKGVVQLSPGHQKMVQDAVDLCHGATARVRAERQERAKLQDEANGEETLVPPQLEITIQFDDKMGHWIIKQKNWPDDDSVIWLNVEHVRDFVESLLHAFGIRSFP